MSSSTQQQEVSVTKAQSKALTAIKDDEAEDYAAQAEDLDDLVARLAALREAAEAVGQKLDEVLRASLADLPTFGGEEPESTIGIWSWDEERLLVGEGSFELVNRAKWTPMVG